MKPKRRTPEQMIGKLREADAMLALTGSPKYFDNYQHGIVNGTR